MHLRKKRFFKIIKLFLLSFLFLFLLLHNNIIFADNPSNNPERDNSEEPQTVKPNAGSTGQDIDTTKKTKRRDDGTIESISEFDQTTGKEIKKTIFQSDGQTIDSIIKIEYDQVTNQKVKETHYQDNGEKNNYINEFDQETSELVKTIHFNIKEVKKTVETSKPEGNEGISNPTVTEKTSNPTAPNAGTNTTHPATAGTNTTPPAALSQKLQTKQLGALDARTEDKVKDAVLTKNPDLKAADRDKLTVQFVGVRNRATQAKITHSELTGTIKVTFSVKKALNTFTKLTTKKITVTQADVTNPTQDTLNKFLKQAGSLTVNNDVTITFNDVDNKKTATITAAPNSTKAQGSVVFTNVKVAQPTAPVVDANATTAPTATTDNRQPNADTNATQQSNGDTNASRQLNAGKTSPADNKLADEKPADDETPADNKVDSKPSEEAAAQKVTDETVKKPTDEAGTKKVADETVKKPADDEKPTDEAGAQKAKEAEAQTAKPVVTAPEAEAQKAKELEAQKTKEAKTQKIEGNTETQKTEGNTETKNPAVTEETSKPEENKGNTETKTTEGTPETKNPAVTEETSKPEENKGNTETKTTDETVKVADEAETKKPKDDEKLADSQDKVETDSKAEVKESDKKQEEKSSLAGLWWTLGIVLTFLSLGSGYYCFQKVKK
nr:putative effector protein PoStoSp14 [Candidatus Phytoplasma solani]